MLSFCFATNLFAQGIDRISYLGRILLKGGNEAIAECKIIDYKLLISQAPPYYIVECHDPSNIKNRTLRIWHTKPITEEWQGKEEDRPANIIVGEIVLPWRKTKKDGYTLMKCEDKQNGTAIVGAFIRNGANEVTQKNALTIFRVLDSGEIEKINFDQILPCIEPGC